MSCKCEYKFDRRKYNLNKKWNNNKYRCECKIPTEHHACEICYIWNPVTFTCENGRCTDVQLAIQELYVIKL